MSLKERREIVALAAEQRTGVLVTLVRAKGSSYRAPGARLLVLPDGRTAGTISGGCLEADLLRKAAWTVRGGAAIERYHTGFDDTAEIPYGLGCGGEVDLMLEPLGTPEAAAVLEALQATLAGEERRIVTILPPVRLGATQPLPAAVGRPASLASCPATAAETPSFGRMVLDGAGDVVFVSEAIATETVVELRRLALSEAAQSGGERGEGERGRGERGGEAVSAGLFVERLHPAQRLVIFGAGEDAKPLARLGAEMGWTVVIADGRAQYARAERFPAAHAVHVASSAAEVTVTRMDAVVLMTHSYEQDRRLLAELLTVRPRYLGVLGARHRSALLLSEAGEQAGLRLQEAVALVSAPVGLSFGGDGPEAIALSITAQIQAELQAAGTPVGHRRMDFAEAERQLLREDTMLARVDLCRTGGADESRTASYQE